MSYPHFDKLIPLLLRVTNQLLADGTASIVGEQVVLTPAGKQQVEKPRPPSEDAIRVLKLLKRTEFQPHPPTYRAASIATHLNGQRYTAACNELLKKGLVKPGPGRLVLTSQGYAELEKYG
jgi:hypothetical protein